MEDYTSGIINKAKLSGASAIEIKKTMESMNQMKNWYKNPILVFLITLLEPTPIGLLFTLVSSFILKRKLA